MKPPSFKADAGWEGRAPLQDIETALTGAVAGGASPDLPPSHLAAPFPSGMLEGARDGSGVLGTTAARKTVFHKGFGRDRLRVRLGTVLLVGLAGLGSLVLVGAAEFRVASYNLENYLAAANGARPRKPEPARRRICEILQTVRPDVLGVQEIGGTASLGELQSRLSLAGVDLPYVEIVPGFDTNIQVALLSRFPITSRQSRSSEEFLIRGRRFRTTRGILDVEITLPSAYRFRVLNVHLKSRRPTGGISQQDIREQEAFALRRIVEGYLRVDPKTNLVVLGDFNDVPSSLAVRAVVGRGRSALVDARPVERLAEGTRERPGVWVQPDVAWTHHYSRDDVYSRVDYILMGAGMARERVASKTWIPVSRGWNEASDHRVLVATFLDVDR